MWRLSPPCGPATVPVSAPFSRFQRTGQLRVHAADTCLVKTHDGLVEGACESEFDRGKWRVTEELQIRLGEECITAAGGHAVTKA